MNKCFLILAFMILAGCSDQAAFKSKDVNWVSAGTLVSVGPATELTRRPDPLRSAVLGETKLSRTRVETTQGVYLVSEKIGIAEPGTPVTVGYTESNGHPGTPSYLKLSGERYEIVH